MPGFLPGQLRLDLTEMAFQDGVHAQAHVFDPAAGQDYRVGGCVAGDGVGDFLQLGEGLGSCSSTTLAPGQQGRAERELVKTAGRCRAAGRCCAAPAPP